ncbi:hypothetical protein E2C01_088109 [Portunus trituberculatus]|uniref:Uncharacterized protein n=1 Tax=Portunus trituberculatus TaxID=210409 RepID=A0A5B7JL24_PORTR|nr:hypothetical protein [Portunus trituberculatus]
MCTTFSSSASKYEFLDLVFQLMERLAAIAHLSHPLSADCLFIELIDHLSVWLDGLSDECPSLWQGCWLAGWLAGYLPHPLAERLAGPMTGFLLVYLAACPPVCSADWLTRS